MTSPAKAFAFLICLVIPVLASGQKLSLEVQGKPASEVLYDFSGRYGLQISFNEKSLSQYKVNITGEFSSPEEAIRKVIENLPFELEKQGDVFIIIPQKKSPKKRTYSITGQVIEKGTREPLPYSHVIINNTGIATDIKGSFSYISSTDSVFQIKATHLGYYILDTLIKGNRNVQFSLSPSIIGLNEVIITHSVVERASLIGREPGVMKLNHQVANFLPGFGDNSVFNLLRLQPGILASGEQTNELIVWGCYEGQSKVIFDGFTLYGLKNFNDNISTFNPLMAKDIEVYKGGFDARYGERVGGIVNITGKNGNTEKTSFTVDINNITMNGMVEIPLFKTGSLIFALRHTYYELYNPGDVNDLFSRGRGNNAVENVDVNIIPDYRFGDMNLKYSARIRNTDLFYISLYSGNDRFSYSINEPFNHIIIKKNTSEKNRQSGGSVFYGKSWKNGYSTHFSLNYTVLNSTFTDNLEIEKVIQQKTEQRIDLYAFNSIRENSLRVDNRFPVHESHILEGGMIYMANRIELAEDTFDIPRVRFDEEAKRMTLYFQDNIKLLNIIDIKAGFRLTRAN
ncbi:MAG TPA: TonB-dependent receptor, partial [Bacteroidales bacterium]|nr:TonB-dependent receptor [Bacteroidales bacterium]